MTDHYSSFQSRIGSGRCVTDMSEISRVSVDVDVNPQNTEVFVIVSIKVHFAM